MLKMGRSLIHYPASLRVRVRHNMFILYVMDFSGKNDGGKNDRGKFNFVWNRENRCRCMLSIINWTLNDHSPSLLRYRFFCVIIHEKLVVCIIVVITLKVFKFSPCWFANRLVLLPKWVLHLYVVTPSVIEKLYCAATFSRLLIQEL